MRRTGYGLIALLSVGVAVYALVGYSLFPPGALVHPDMRSSFESHRLGIYGHVFGASFALLLGPLQFSVRLRAAYPATHRLIGRLYLAMGVGVGGLAGLYLAFFAHGGWIARSGFALLAVAWLTTGMRAYLAARSRRLPEHRAWMVRNYALALAAVTLRLYLGPSLAAGLDFETTYRVVAWACWLPNLLLAEWLLRRSAWPG